MMNPRKRRAFRALALVLAFAFAQLSLETGLAGRGDPTLPKSSGLVTSRLTTRDNDCIPQTRCTPDDHFVTSRLTTRNNQPILVDALSAKTGATIFSGAIIETPDKVGATIRIGSCGKLDLAPNTKVRLDFDQSCKIKVTMIQGCVVLRTKPNTTGSIDTAKGEAGKTGTPGGELNVCFDHGVLGIGTAAGAGAAVGVAVGAAGAGAAAGGVSGLVIAGVVLGVALPVAVVAASRGQN